MNYRKSEAKEASRARFRGLWTAITTPFARDGALDEAAAISKSLAPVRADIERVGLLARVQTARAAAARQQSRPHAGRNRGDNR